MSSGRNKQPFGPPERDRSPVRRDASRAGDAEALVLAALDRRETLLAAGGTNAVRLLHAEADGVPGLVIEQFADVLIAQLHEGRLRLAEEEVRDLCALVMERRGARAVYRKLFPRDRSTLGPELEALHNDPTPWCGEPVEETVTIHEQGHQFRIRPWRGYSVGLFLEQRDNRARIRELAPGRHVLNAFAYTCGFSVVAAAAGATTVSLDVSRAYLDWGRANFELNGLSNEGHAIVRSDVTDYFRRAQRRGEQFDLIILDPPTFGRQKRPRRVFSFATGAPRLAADALGLLRPKGVLLLCTNHRGTTVAGLRRMVRAGAGQRAIQRIETPEMPVDFAGDAEYAKTILVEMGGG